MTAPTWKGRRGEWFVAVQLVLFAFVAFGPRTLPVLPAWRWPEFWSAAGFALIVAGLLLAAWASLHLLGARAFTPLPYPRDGGRLVETGPYGLARHPIYAGVLLCAFGWAVRVQGTLTLAYALVLFALLDVKSRREERWLAARFSGYVRYRRRVRKLIPFVW
ncbi:MAG: isoprenylcysteine carboxylmethyltransferase family protein [Candidatus Eisenbacteria bacterium]